VVNRAQNQLFHCIQSLVPDERCLKSEGTQNKGWRKGCKKPSDAGPSVMKQQKSAMLNSL